MGNTRSRRRLTPRPIATPAVLSPRPRQDEGELFAPARLDLRRALPLHPRSSPSFTVPASPTSVPNNTRLVRKNYISLIQDEVNPSLSKPLPCDQRGFPF